MLTWCAGIYHSLHNVTSILTLQLPFLQRCFAGYGQPTFSLANTQLLINGVRDIKLTTQRLQNDMGTVPKDLNEMRQQMGMHTVQLITI